MKKALVATVVALISIHASATTQSVCKNKIAGSLLDSAKKHSTLLPGGKSTPAKSTATVRSRGTR